MNLEKGLVNYTFDSPTNLHPFISRYALFKFCTYVPDYFDPLPLILSKTIFKIYFHNQNDPRKQYKICNYREMSEVQKKINKLIIKCWVVVMKMMDDHVHVEYVYGIVIV